MVTFKYRLFFPVLRQPPTYSRANIRQTEQPVLPAKPCRQTPRFTAITGWDSIKIRLLSRVGRKLTFSPITLRTNWSEHLRVGLKKRVPVSGTAFNSFRLQLPKTKLWSMI